MQSIESLGLITYIVINEKCIGAHDNDRILYIYVKLQALKSEYYHS